MLIAAAARCVYLRVGLPVEFFPAALAADVEHAVRNALTDDGPPPLSASGLQLHERLTAIQESLERVDKKGLYRSRSRS